FAVGHLSHHGRVISPAETGKGQGGYVRLAKPWRNELGPISYDQQNSKIADALDEDIDELSSGRINPMRILQNKEDWSTSCKVNETGDESLQEKFLTALWADRQWRASVTDRNREQVGEQRSIAANVVRPRFELAGELADSSIVAVGRLEARCLFKLLDDGMECGLVAMRRAVTLHTCVRIRFDRIPKRCHDARLADAGLAPNKDHPAFASFCLPPPTQQKFQFLITTDELRPVLTQCFKPVYDPAFA